MRTLQEAIAASKGTPGRHCKVCDLPEAVRAQITVNANRQDRRVSYVSTARWIREDLGVEISPGAVRRHVVNHLEHTPE